tara:strand:+ start:31988 stop:32818 length:831 start_codon:yes stop_codon:yes gene_type:complete
MAKLRSVSTAFWSDPFIEDLTPNEKLLFLYLVTNEKTNMLGIYESSVKKISFETGLTKSEVFNALKGFEKVSKVKYINNFVILVNFMKHQNFNTNMKKSAIDVYNNLPNELKGSDLNISKLNPSEGFETLLNHFGMVPKLEVEVEDEIEVEDVLVKKVKTFSPSVYTCLDNCLKNFPNHLQPKNNKSCLDTIEKLNRIDKIPFELIEQIVKKTREDTFWSKNFLSINKLRNKDKNGVMYVSVFAENIKSNNNNLKPENNEQFKKITEQIRTSNPNL